MKYCSKCKRVYLDGIDCNCMKEKRNSWDKPVMMIDLDCEAICKCGSVVGLIRHEPHEWITQDKIDPAFCRCAVCEKKYEDARLREESMKWLIIDNYQDENKFCDSKDEVEEFLKFYIEDSDWDSGPLDDVLILKLEPVTERLKESDFKPICGNYNPDTSGWDREPNTHIVIWDGEIFRVEEVITPELEYDGGRSINW